jgi:excinuclease ABC subunit C
VTTEQYLQQVQAACGFLDGQCEELVGQLEGEMRRAAGRLDYEKAAQLRDTITDLKRSTERTNKFKRLPYTLPLALDPRQDMTALGQALGLPGPPDWIEGFDISNISGTFCVSSMVCFRQGKPDRSAYRRYRMKTVTGQDDFAAMAETIQRRYTRMLKESRKIHGDEESERNPGTVLSEAAVARGDELRAAAPGLILVDGGKGQLNAAHGELIKLGLGDIPIIGLAKEFEEIYRPGEKEPMRLSHDSGALKLLQRVRDESHRFANTYNARLRLRKISESVLDEFPGMGEKRKAALLKHFGSVHRLRLATEEEIAGVPGFGSKVAARLKAFLEARS